MFWAAAGLPCGYRVTVPLPQFAIQMLPPRSERVACGKEIPPCVKPAAGERARRAS